MCIYNLKDIEEHNNETSFHSDQTRGKGEQINYNFSYTCPHWISYFSLMNYEGENKVIATGENKKFMFDLKDPSNIK